MNDYLQFKLDLGQRLDQLHQAVEELAQDQFIDSLQVAKWHQHLNHARNSLQDVPLRIAVVGAVKSGKSTLINALVGCDLLKRGAGVTTAFITRIITNEQWSGWVEFKSWPQVIQELEQVLRVLALGDGGGIGEEPLDIRKDSDRLRLTQIRDALQAGLATGPTALNPHLLLLNAYLQGYPQAQAKLGETATRLALGDPTLRDHQDYVAREDQAVYLQDLELHLPAPWLGDHLEIADCQGSDSPNPVHFAALQNHLLRSHFIVYLISGRTGLREADFRLLNVIKSLRMLPHTLFVLNVDLDCHPHEDDFNQFCQRVQTELRWFAPEPRLFAFSALYHLIRQLDDQAPAPERGRLQAWSDGTPWPAVTEAGFTAFRETLNHQVDQHRRQVLLDNAVNRATMVAGSLADATATIKEFLAEDRDTVSRALQELREKQETFRSACRTVQQAIMGAQDSLRAELNHIIDRVFDLRTGPLVKETLALIDQSSVQPGLLASMSSTLEVVQRVHPFYLKFRQDLWGALVEKINVKIIEFAKDQEAWLLEQLRQAAATYWSLFTTAMGDYRQELARLHIPVQSVPPLNDTPWLEIDRTTPPQFSAFVHQVPLSRPLLLAKFGLGRLSCYLEGFKSRLGRRFMEDHSPAQPSSLQEALSLVKAETRTELQLAFRDYRRQFQRAYALPLLDGACNRLLREFETRAELAQVSFVDAFQHGVEHRERQHQVVDTLAEVQQLAEAVRAEMDTRRLA
jgi:hypothetical protein